MNTTRDAPVILVVDDEPANIAVLGEALRLEGDVRFALCGEDALRLIRDGPTPAVVLLDVMMPGMSGFQVCETLQSHPVFRDVPVLFVTALADPESEVRGLSAGGVDYLTKPFHPNIVRQRVRVHLRRFRSEHGRRRCERVWRGAAEAAGELLYELNTDDGTFHAWLSPSAERSPRLPDTADPDRITVDDWRGRVHPDDLARLDAMLGRVRSGDVERASVAYRVLGPDGRTHHYRDCARLVPGLGGGPATVVGVCGVVER